MSQRGAKRESNPVALAVAKHKILATCHQADHLLLALDFDGTLVPIQKDPFAPRLNATQRRLLTQLSKQPGVTLCFISGRAVRDVRRRVGILGAYYIGNHGLEIRHRGKVLSQPPPGILRRIRVAQREVTKQLGKTKGVIIENKGPVLTVHYRQTPQPQWKRISAEIAKTLRHQARGAQLKVVTGKAIVELRPESPHDKGWALRWVERHLREAQELSRSPLIVALGDDRTDEDMFRRIGRNGITIHVGRQQTCATYRTTGTDRVWQFLQSLLK